MAIILLILIAIIIWLLIKIYDYKKINTKLSKQNNELAERIKLLIGTSQLHSENSDEKSRQGYATGPHLLRPTRPCRPHCGARQAHHPRPDRAVY